MNHNTDAVHKLIAEIDAEADSTWQFMYAASNAIDDCDGTNPKFAAELAEQLTQNLLRRLGGYRFADSRVALAVRAASHRQESTKTEKTAPDVRVYIITSK